MAFLPSGAREEEEKDQKGMDVISSAQGAGLDATGTAPAQGAVKGGSGQFTNIQDYIEANRPKTQQLAQGITGAVQEEVTGLGSALEQQREQYLGQEGKFGAGQSDFIAQQIEQAGQYVPPTVPGDQQEESTEPVSPQYQQTSDADLERFRSLATGGQQAPDLGEQRRQAAELERRSKQFETSAGRFEGLQRLVGKKAPTYGRGQRQLDQLLLAGDRPSKLQSIRDIRGATAGLGTKVGKLGKDIAAGRAARQQEAVSQLGTARTAEQEARQAREERFAGLDVGGRISEADLGVLGLGREQVANLYGVDPSEYIRTGGVSAERQARLGALAALGGETTQYDPSRIYAGPEQFLGDIQAAKGQYEQAYGPGATAAGWRKFESDPGIRYMRRRGEHGRQVVEAERRHIEGLWGQGQRAGDGLFSLYSSGRTAAEAAARRKYQYGQGLLPPELT